MEQTPSSNETPAIIDATLSKAPSEAEKEQCLVNPAFVIKKHLTEIYLRLNQLEAKIEKHISDTSQKTDAVDEIKLSVREFREFVDLLNKTLIETLPTGAAAAQVSTVEIPLKIENMESETPTKENAEPEQTQRNETTTASPQPTPSGSNTHQRNFPLKTNGEIFYLGNGVTAVVGDTEIQPNTEVDEFLVIRGTLKTGEACKFLKDVKALQNVEIGRDSTIEGNLVSFGKITMGPNCQVKGAVQGDIQQAADDKPPVDSSGS